MKDVLIRSGKTLWQAVLAYLLAHYATVNLQDSEMVKGLIAGSIAAGLCAVWNGVVSPFLNKIMKRSSESGEGMEDDK